MTRKQTRTAGRKKIARKEPSKKTAKGTARAKKEASRSSNTVAAEKRSRASRATSDGQTESGSDLRHQAIAWAARRLQG